MLPTSNPASLVIYGAHMPPLGRLAGAFAVICGLTVTANILMALAVDHFGWFGIEQHGINLWRVADGALMVAGIALTAMF